MSGRSLCSGTNSQTRWYPVSIDDWDNVLNTLSYNGHRLLPDREIRRNIAYNLQYLEYLEQTLEELSLSTVLTKQTYKSYIIVAIGVVESLLYFINAVVGGREKRLFDILNSLKATPFLRTDKQLYDALQRFRKLRNKVHLHEFHDDLTTDYASFGHQEFNQMREILYKLVKKRKLGLPKQMLKLFEFLNRPAPQK